MGHFRWGVVVLLASVGCGTNGEAVIGAEDAPALDESTAELNDPHTGAIVGLAGKCLNVEGALTANGTRVILWDCQDGTNEKWTFGANNKITGLGGKCLTASGNSNGSQVTISTCTGAANQKWAKDTNTHLRNVGSGLCLNVYGGSSVSGTPIIVWPCTSGTLDDSKENEGNYASDSDNEKWFLEPNVTLRLEFLNVNDSTGIARKDPAGSAAPFTVAQLLTTLDGLNTIYRPQHIQFVFDPATDYANVYDTEINDIACAKGDTDSAWARSFARSFRYPGKIAVYLRHGPGSAGPIGQSCSAPPWSGGNSVLMRNWYSAKGPGDNGSAIVLAHELGHYLALDHPFATDSDDPTTKLGDGTNPITTLPILISVLQRETINWFDADGISDTRPDPGTGLWTGILGMQLCGGSDNATPGTFLLSPQRDNVMGYYGCDPQVFSRKQRLKIRRGLAHPMRQHLTETPQAVRTPRQLWGERGNCLQPERVGSPLGQKAAVAPCASSNLFTFDALGEIKYGTVCLTESNDSTVSARPYFDTCRGVNAQRWTRQDSGRVVSWGGRSLYGDPAVQRGAVYQGYGTLDPQMVWGSYFPLPVSTGPN